MEGCGSKTCGVKMSLLEGWGAKKGEIQRELEEEGEKKEKEEEKEKKEENEEQRMDMMYGDAF